MSHKRLKSLKQNSVRLSNNFSVCILVNGHSQGHNIQQ